MKFVMPTKTLNNTQLLKKKEGKCITLFCRKDAADGRNVCFRCMQERYRKRNPIRYTFNTNKQNAKRRGHEFTLTFEQFKAFCIETDYIELKGRSMRSMSIDRIDNSKGYVHGNIQLLSVSGNSSKGAKQPF